MFIYRLIFAVRFAEFHQRKMKQEYMDAAGDVVAMLKEEVAPRAWWAVVLCDAVDLLQNSAYFLLSIFIFRSDSRTAVDV